MKKLVFNDSRQLDIQSVTVAGNGVLHVRMILTSSDALKAVFGDEFATQKMTYFENQVQVAVYEKYTILKYIKEETGGIWEVEMLQPEKDPETKIAELTEELDKAKDELTSANNQITDLQMAICELYEGMVIS